MGGTVSTLVVLAGAALAGAITGLLAAVFAARLGGGAATAGAVDPERLAALERRCAALEGDALARAEGVEARMTAWRAQAHGIATVLRNLADAQRKAERAAEQRSATLIRRAADQVEHLADRVFTLEARLADPPAVHDAGPPSLAAEPDDAPPAGAGDADPPERLPEPAGPETDEPPTERASPEASGPGDAPPEPTGAPAVPQAALDPDPPRALDVAGLPGRVVSVVPR